MQPGIGGYQRMSMEKLE
uniref:Glycosyltransferase QUASIMODO1, putative n=1 Tax=Arundo donax TaxID=35708 RepID=A0A0A9D182_ARUDO